MNTDSWFTGFADGEGSFMVSSIAYNGYRYYRPQFRINLRADDMGILETLAETFGGTTFYEEEKEAEFPGGRRYVSKPRGGWSVHKKEDLAGLVEYFDRFPPKTKKLRDYKIWRLAVFAYIENGRADKRLPELQRQIRETRKYR